MMPRTPKERMPRTSLSNRDDELPFRDLRSRNEIPKFIVAEPAGERKINRTTTNATKQHDGTNNPRSYPQIAQICTESRNASPELNLRKSAQSVDTLFTGAHRPHP